MSAPDHAANARYLSVKQVNQVLVGGGFNLKKGDAHKVFDVLRERPNTDIFEAAKLAGIERSATAGKQSRQQGRFKKTKRASAARSARARLITFLAKNVLAALTSNDTKNRFLQLVAEEALEGTAAAVVDFEQQGRKMWRIEDSGRPHLLVHQTIEEFIAQPAPGYDYEGKTLASQDMILLAGEIIEEIFSETIDYVVDVARERGPAWVRALMPQPAETTEHEALIDAVFDAVNELEETGQFTSQLGSVAGLSFKDTILTYRPEASARIEADQRSQLMRNEALNRAKCTLVAKAELLRKELIGPHGTRLPKSGVPSMVNRIIEEADSLEGLFLVMELLKNDRVISCVDRTGQALFDEYVAGLDAAFGRFPVIMETPLAMLFLRLNEERKRFKRNFTVTAITQDGTSFIFDDRRWAYFMAWALTNALGSSYSLFRIVIQREEKLMEARRSVPMKSLAGLLVDGAETHRLSAQEMLSLHTTDVDSGETVRPEPGLRYIDFKVMLPGLFDQKNPTARS